MSSSLIKAYQLPQMKKYMASQSVQTLLHKSVQFYVGSRSTPRNENIVKLLMSEAQKIAQSNNNPNQINQVQYYHAYFAKMSAIATGNNKEYDLSSDKFMEIAQNGHKMSNYLVGKQMYRMVETGEIGNWQNQLIVEKANEVFGNSLNDQQYAGLYYIADIDQKHKKPDEEQQRLLFELYVQAASLGYPLAYFKVASKYKNKGNFKMYKKYLIQAAENGVIEAQHNLALQYMNGQHFPQDQIKAVAWFLQASAQGFVYSKYNLSKFFWTGTSCGKIKMNKKASLVYLEQISRTGEIDVSKEIEEIVKILDKTE